MKFEVNKPENEWKKELTPEQYYVLREKGTEKPFTGKLLMNQDKGKYTCAACGNELFDSDAKFESHCGWPSFDREIKDGKIVTQDDYSYGRHRTEIMCGKCGGHLGHIFDDGPTDTGKRYCVNSASLAFQKEGEKPKEEEQLKTLVLGGGCYWCTEAIYNQLKGVESVESGFAGGNKENPTYKEVCNGDTGHAEAVQIKYNPKEISEDDLLTVFFSTHDPTTLNRQGNDVGTQYRSVIFYNNEAEKQKAQQFIDELNKEKVFDAPIVTTLEPLKKFYKAEDYHQDYYKNNSSQPYCQYVIKPKVDKFQKHFQNLLKTHTK